MFLGAGSVMHGTNDDVDMRHYGALRKLMPVTFLTFTMGYLAIIGFPGFSGFWSKDKIIETALAQNTWLGICALLGAGVTGFYMTRLMLMTFFGKERWEDGVHPHESPKVMTDPADRARRRCRSSAACCCSTTGSSTSSRRSSALPPHEEPPLPALVISVIAVRRGRRSASGIAWMLFGRQRRPAGGAREGLGVHHRRPQRALRRRVQRRGHRRTRQAVHLAGWRPSTRRSSTAASWARPAAFGGISGRLRLAQNGFVRSYALVAARRRCPRPPRPRGGEPRMNASLADHPAAAADRRVARAGAAALPARRGTLPKQIALGFSRADARARRRPRHRLRARRRHAVRRGRRLDQAVRRPLRARARRHRPDAGAAHRDPHARS